MTITEVISRWQINPSLLADAMAMPEHTFIKKLTDRDFSEEELRELNKALNHLRKDLGLVQVPVEKPVLSKEQIDAICDEIEHQWLHLVITRAVFPNASFPTMTRYESPDFYSTRHIQFRMEILTHDTPNFKLAAAGLKVWHNKNFVIRLYGILDRYQIMAYGRKACKSDLMELIYRIRQKIGAHNTGRKPSENDDIKELAKAAALIKKLFPLMNMKGKDIAASEDYWLPIDDVLEPMKNRAIQFVRSLG